MTQEPLPSDQDHLPKPHRASALRPRPPPLHTLGVLLEQARSPPPLFGLFLSIIANTPPPRLQNAPASPLPATGPMFFPQGIQKESSLPTMTPPLVCVLVLRNPHFVDGLLLVNVPTLDNGERNPLDQIFPAPLPRFFLPTQREFVGELRSSAG